MIKVEISSAKGIDDTKIMEFNTIEEIWTYMFKEYDSWIVDDYREAPYVDISYHLTKYDDYVE